MFRYSTVENTIMTPVQGPKRPLSVKVVGGAIATLCAIVALSISVVNLTGHSPKIEWAIGLTGVSLVILNVVFAGRTWANWVRKIFRLQ